MGGNVKDAMTEDLKVTRECTHCGSEFTDDTKYAPERYCDECKSHFNDPKYIEPSVQLKVDENEGVLVTEIVLNNTSPEHIPVHISGKNVDEGTLFAEVLLESESGWCKDHLCSPKYRASKHGTNPLTVQETVMKIVSYPANSPQSIRKNHYKKQGPVLNSDEITVTVDFYCSKLGSYSDTLTTADIIATHI